MAGPESVPTGGASGAASVATGGGGSQAPWILSGAMFVVLLIMLVRPILQPEAAPVATQTATPFGDAGAVDLSTMSPREQADRLFTRVMTAATAGDSVEVGFFVPMALQAYENLDELDPDAYFHMSMLQQTVDDLDAALASARQGLAMHEDHILLLYAEAEALILQDDEDAAVANFNQILDVWTEERASDRIDYRAHDNMFFSIEARARELTGR